MSLQTRLNALVTAIATDIKSLITGQGNLAALDTTAKTNLVAAINEVNAALAGAGGAPEVLDMATTGDTVHTWSADKIITELNALKSGILSGVDPAYDTLLEIAATLGSQDTAVNNLLAAVGNRIRFDAAQTLTTPQQAQACANIGVGDPEIDLAAAYATAKA
jgi:hypothetical protein